MDNEELKKKIVEIIQGVDFYDGLLYRYCIDIATADKLADALIAAGIGDTTNIIVENEVLQRDVDNLTRTLEEGTEEFQEVQHRAEVAERALRNVTELAGCAICDNFNCKYYNGETRKYNAEECIKWWLVQAEKELQEEKKDG